MKSQKGYSGAAGVNKGTMSPYMPSKTKKSGKKGPSVKSDLDYLKG